MASPVVMGGMPEKSDSYCFLHVEMPSMAYGGQYPQIAVTRGRNPNSAQGDFGPQNKSEIMKIPAMILITRSIEPMFVFIFPSFASNELRTGKL
ncbi:MAG: hypothetical protein A2W25_09795 [candidate division Zixibacteria bacterium RBG_16_53_22]|nr:MAG: hypothetical protein A2W25_09795 [candidate division Zixibacteria bacterium RBG_16_53_22]